MISPIPSSRSPRTVPGVVPAVARSLVKLGRDIEVARKKRQLTVAALCGRAGISASLYKRMTEGRPGTAINAYAMVFFALGLGTPMADLVDAGRDDTGLMLDIERLPRRIRPRRDKSGAL